MFFWTISAAGSPCAADRVAIRSRVTGRGGRPPAPGSGRQAPFPAAPWRGAAGGRRMRRNGRLGPDRRGALTDLPVRNRRLTRLHLTCIRDRLESLIDEAAEKQLTLREAVAFLVDREVARRNERRLGTAHFPAVRELADFDFKAQPSVDKRHIRELATVSLGGARRLGLVPRSARGREVASRHSPGARGRPPRLLGAVRDGLGGDGVAGQGARQGRSRALSS